MRKLYSILAWAIAAGVVVQAAAIGFGYGGMQAYVEGGGVVDDVVVESGPGSYTGDVAFPVHELVGGMVIPALVVLLGVVSFWVRVPRARRWAWGLFLLVAVQAEMGYAVPEFPYVGIVHGANALAVLLVAVHVARLPRRTAAEVSAAAQDDRDAPAPSVPA